jgi:tungstate transport system substrate-binding protein
MKGDKVLFNPYGVIAVNPEKHPDIKINYDGAIAFIDWITGAEGQKMIEEFGAAEFGQPLFYPDAVN